MPNCKAGDYSGDINSISKQKSRVVYSKATAIICYDSFSYTKVWYKYHSNFFMILI